MRIAITGASGLLGANLFLGWSTGGHDVLGIYSSHAIAAPGAASQRADLFAVDALTGALGDFRADWVVHAAAMTNVDECEKRPDVAMKINSEMSRCVALAAKKSGARLVYISTDSVFDGSRGGYDVDDAPAPVNAYAQSKLAGEREVAGILPDALIVRTNIYGWNAQKKNSLAEFMLHKLRAGEKFTGFDEVIFSPLLANQLGDILMGLIRAGASGVVHAGARDAVSKYEFGLRIAGLFDLDAKLVGRGSSTSFPFAAKRPRDTSLDASSAARWLACELPDVDGGLREFRRLEEENWPVRLRNCMEEKTHG
jgi:dTDP-4-dehydrorhamnose reductase